MLLLLYKCMNATTKHDLCCKLLWYYGDEISMYTNTNLVHSPHNTTRNLLACKNMRNFQILAKLRGSNGWMCIATYLLLQAPSSLGHAISLHQTSPFWVAWFGHSSNRWCLLYSLAATIDTNYLYITRYSTWSHISCECIMRERGKRFIIHDRSSGTLH